MKKTDETISFLELKVNYSKDFRLTVKDAIVSLLGAMPEYEIETRTLLFKELFLLYKEILNSAPFKNNFQYIDPEFVPYIYGPFSFQAASGLGVLVFSGIISKSGDKRNQSFKLTSKGMANFEYIKIRIRDIPHGNEFIESLSEKRIEWDPLGREGIMARIRNYFPNYFIPWKNSKIQKFSNTYTEADIGIEPYKVDSSFYGILSPSSRPNEGLSAEEWVEKLQEEFGGLIWAESYKE